MMTREYAYAGSASDGDLLTTEQVAAMSPFKGPTLAKWRRSWPDGACRGPKPVRVEGRVFYRRADVQEWLRSQIGS